MKGRWLIVAGSLMLAIPAVVAAAPENASTCSIVTYQIRVYGVDPNLGNIVMFGRFFDNYSRCFYTGSGVREGCYWDPTTGWSCAVTGVWVRS